MSEWISVKERLPDKNCECICYIPSNYGSGIGVLSYAECLEKVDKYELHGKKYGGFYGYDSEWGYYEGKNITHWMPLPKPPEDKVTYSHRLCCA